MSAIKQHSRFEIEMYAPAGLVGAHQAGPSVALRVEHEQSAVAGTTRRPCWPVRNFEVGLFALCLLLLGCDASDCDPEPAANPCTVPALESGECPIIIETTAPNGERARACNCIDLYTGGDFWADCSAASCSACCEQAGGHFFPQCPGGPEC